MNRFPAILLLLTVTLACTSQKAVPLTSGEWTLIKMSNEDVSRIRRPVTLKLDTENAKAAGFAGCNQFFSSYTLKENYLQFTETGSTKMFCEDT